MRCSSRTPLQSSKARAQIFHNHCGSASVITIQRSLCRWYGKPLEVDSRPLDPPVGRRRRMLCFDRSNRFAALWTNVWHAACGRQFVARHRRRRTGFGRHRRLGAQQGFRVNFSAVAGRDSQGMCRNIAQTDHDALLEATSPGRVAYPETANLRPSRFGSEIVQSANRRHGPIQLYQRQHVFKCAADRTAPR